MQRSATVTRTGPSGWARGSDLARLGTATLHGMKVVKACIGLAVPGRPIGPWSRRTGAPEASATRRDRNPMLTGLLTACATTPRDERVQDGTALRRPPSLKAWWRPGEHRRAHRVRNLGPGARPFERRPKP
jgi:hypothetical protein